MVTKWVHWGVGQSFVTSTFLELARRASRLLIFSPSADNLQVWKDTTTSVNHKMSRSESPEDSDVDEVGEAIESQVDDCKCNMDSIVESPS